MRSRAAQITDLTDYDGNPVQRCHQRRRRTGALLAPTVRTTTYGWVAARARGAGASHVLTATIGDGTVGDIAADASISRKQVPEPRSSDSTGVFSVKDFGLVGDGMTGDCARHQASHRRSRGAAVAFPPGCYLVEGTLTVRRSTALRGGSRIGQRRNRHH